MLKRWLFWLPVCYLAPLCWALLDMKLEMSGGGEANSGAWVYALLYMVPAGGLAKMLGFNLGPMTSVYMGIGLELLVLVIIGAKIDAMRRRNGQL
jgi:hypothetical protein